MTNDTTSSRPTRREKKARVQAFEDLAKELAEMDLSQYSQIEIPEDLRPDIELARSTKGFNSRKRQTKYLASVLKANEEDCAALQQSIEVLRQEQRSHVHVFHDLESLRNRLCDKTSFEEAQKELQERVGKDAAAALSRLARSVHQSKDKRAFREIFKRLQKLLATPEESS